MLDIIYVWTGKEELGKIFHIITIPEYNPTIYRWKKLIIYVHKGKEICLFRQAV
jgi:hypothetical protein